MVIMMLKRLICALVALSFVFAGTPVLAAAKDTPCPMEKMHSKMQNSSAQSDMSGMKMDMKDCDKCPKSAEKKQAEKTKKGGCCDDQSCNAKCAALSSAGGQLFPSNDIQWNGPSAKEKVTLLPYLLPPSHLLKTPEKPPKYLS
ncbi:MAG TPA: hypothetical protein DEA55_01820 [Rhodospirillaceae bacterium]|nr:hypothetical protein [Rhodospirillaceae bacterium]